MRVLVAGGSLSGAERIAFAAAGLALRGHRVHWLGRLPAPLGAPGIEPAGLRTLPAARAEVVVAGHLPLRPALAGWITGAEAMVLEMADGDLPRWGTLGRLAWPSLYGIALAPEERAAALTLGPGGLDRERIGLWPAAAAPAAPDPSHPDVEVLERACERALARHRSRSPRAAVFVDRDGTLIREHGYLADPGNVELLPGVGRALRTLLNAGHPVVMVSNQSGIERGYFSAATAYAVMARVRERLREEGVELTAVYLCPHRPETGCACRKPRTGLLERAADDLVLSLRDSVTVGDKRIDVATGHAAGGAGVLVRSGYGAEEERSWPAGGRAADAVVDGLPEAAEWVLARAH